MAGEGKVKDLLWRDNTWGCLAWLISLAVLWLLVLLEVLPSSIFDPRPSCASLKHSVPQYDRDGRPVDCD